MLKVLTLEVAVNLARLTNAYPAIQLHAYAALAAFVLGVVQLTRKKGTLSHRTLGYVWAGLMLVVAMSSFWIHDLRVWGPWSPIHLLSIFTLAMLPYGIFMARSRVLIGHKMTMLGLFAGALVIAGLFTLAPGRIMDRVMLGG
jgi:uncharacterized membrane protein